MRPRPMARLSALVGVVCLAALAAPGPARAAEATPRLAVVAVGEDKSYFEVTLAPGESRRLAVQVSNPGTVPVAARTYPADAYSLINGGFGAELRTERSGGTTTWLDYRPETLPLEPGAVVTRDFTISAPRGVASGEYITSVVVEHDLPSRGEGVVLKQVTRHVVAVAVTVPGPLVAGLATGAGRHTTVDGRSVFGIEVRNTGNTHLRPRGELVVTDAAGVVVHRGAVTMDTFYAGTNTFIEQPLDRLLPEGTYTISATLADPAKAVSVAAAPVPVEVAAPEPLSAPASGALPAIGRAVDDIRRGEASPLLLAGAAVVLFVSGLLIALTAVALVSRRRRRRDAPTAGIPASSPAEDPTRTEDDPADPLSTPTSTTRPSR